MPSSTSEAPLQYVIVPHSGNWSNSSPFLPALAHWLNEGYAVSRAREGTPQVPFDAPLVHCHGDDAEVSVLKPAEDGTGFVLRLAEIKKRRSAVTIALHPALAVRGIAEADLLERALSSAPKPAVTKRSGIVVSFSMTLQPHEIKTVLLRCTPARQGKSIVGEGSGIQTRRRWAVGPLHL